MTEICYLGKGAIFSAASRSSERSYLTFLEVVQRMPPHGWGPIQSQHLLLDTRGRGRLLRHEAVLFSICKVHLTPMFRWDSRRYRLLPTAACLSVSACNQALGWDARFEAQGQADIQHKMSAETVSCSKYIQILQVTIVCFCMKARMG